MCRFLSGERSEVKSSAIGWDLGEIGESLKRGARPPWPDFKLGISVQLTHGTREGETANAAAGRVLR